MIEAASLIISLLALFMSGLALYYHFLVGPNIKLVFSDEDKNLVWDKFTGTVETNGVFINKGNRAGYVVNNPLNKRTKLTEEFESKKRLILHVPSFLVTIEPPAPLGLSFEPKKIETPLSLKEGEVFYFKIYFHRQSIPHTIGEEEVDKWFKENSGLTVRIRIYYTTTKPELEMEYETINLKI